MERKEVFLFLKTTDGKSVSKNVENLPLGSSEMTYLAPLHFFSNQQQHFKETSKEL